jgi:hypothetical protein
MASPASSQNRKLADVSHTKFSFLQRGKPIISLQTICVHGSDYGDSTAERVGDSFFPAFGTDAEQVSKLIHCM